MDSQDNSKIARITNTSNSSVYFKPFAPCLTRGTIQPAIVTYQNFSECKNKYE